MEVLARKNRAPGHTTYPKTENTNKLPRSKIQHEIQHTRNDGKEISEEFGERRPAGVLFSITEPTEGENNSFGID